MRVDDAADVGKREKQPAMRGRVGGRVKRAFNLFAVKIDEHHVVRFEGGVVHAGRFNGKDPASAVDRTGVAEGEIDQAFTRKGEIGFVSFAFEFFEHGAKASLSLKVGVEELNWT